MLKLSLVAVGAAFVTVIVKVLGEESRVGVGRTNGDRMRCIAFKVDECRIVDRDNTRAIDLEASASAVRQAEHNRTARQAGRVRVDLGHVLVGSPSVTAGVCIAVGNFGWRQARDRFDLWNVIVLNAPLKAKTPDSLNGGGVGVTN